MPRVHKVEHARKPIEASDIAVGDSYYWWKFKNRVGNGTKVVSKTFPKPSQLTRSAFASAWRGFSEIIADLPLDDDLYSALQDVASDIRELGEEAQASLDNMPEGLQQGPTGELLTQRAENAEAWASEIESLDEPVYDDTEGEPDRADYEEGADGDADFAEAVEEHIGGAAERWDEQLADLKQQALDADPGEA